MSRVASLGAPRASWKGITLVKRKRRQTITKCVELRKELKTL